MKYLMRLAQPRLPVPARPPFQHLSPALAGPRDGAVPTIEEYAAVDLVPLTGRTSRWRWVAITVGIAIVGLGFAGHRIGLVAGPSTASVVARTVQRPAERPSEAEIVSVLEVSSTTAAGLISVGLRRSTASGQSGDDMRLLIDGHAPSDLEAVTIDIQTSSGSLLASTGVPSVGDERPGSDGGPRVGDRSLRWELVVPGPVPPDGWQVKITWREGSDGSLGSVVQQIPAINLGRS